MAAITEILANLKENYENTEFLVNEISKQDPPTEPFKSHYEARRILLDLSQTIKQHLDNLKESATPEDLSTLQFILAHITVDLGKIYNFTEELATGEQYLNEAIELLKDEETNPKAIYATVNALNALGILWMNRGETEKSQAHLINAETYFKTFTEKQVPSFTTKDLFAGEGNANDKELEKNHALTLFYLAQVFGKLGNLGKSAIYCHYTLKKQLQINDFDPIDWALNSATLSQYFCTNNRYTEARHHLAAATQILLEHQNDVLKPGMTDDEKKAADDNFNHRLADVNRCWIKYALNLMSDSRERLLSDAEDADIAKLKISDRLLFGAKVDEAYENIITDRYLLDMDDAKPVFLTTLKWIEKAKSYYTADSEASEYSKIVQDHALMYKHLAFFEVDPANQAKMHKRRVDLFEELLDLLNRIFYMNIVQEVLYELASAYSNILDIKLEIFEQSQKSHEPPNPSALKKINDLIIKSRKNFLEFISTYFQPKTEEFKKELTNDELIPVAFSYFQVARISYKFVTPNKQLQYNNLSICLDNYQKFVALCAKHEEVGNKMKGEVGVSKEMIQLLPLKLERVRADMIST